MTEGLRYNAGKIPYEMIPLHLLEGTSRVFYDVTTREINPYPKWNWTAPKEWSVPYACIMRHLSKWYTGEDVDEETGHSHISHAICNLLMLEHYRTSCPERDDRPKKEFTKNEGPIAQAAGAVTGAGPGSCWQDYVSTPKAWP